MCSKVSHGCKAEADIVLVEGAGSASEINLRANDIANMGFARAADVPVVLIGDIDRGGVIASLVGTKAVIAPDDAALICGFIVNKFRGDPALFADGMDANCRSDRLAAARSGAVFRRRAAVAGGRCAGARCRCGPAKANGRLRIAVPILPHIANFDDLDPLDAEPAVDLVRVRPGTALPGDADLVLLPGSKATIADLAALRVGRLRYRHRRASSAAAAGFSACAAAIRCSDVAIADPDGIEGAPGRVDGLGLIDVETTLSGDKRLEAGARRRPATVRRSPATRCISV